MITAGSSECVVAPPLPQLSAKEAGGSLSTGWFFVDVVMRVQKRLAVRAMSLLPPRTTAVRRVLPHHFEYSSPFGRHGAVRCINMY
jgi:hypothetical protein